MVFRKTARKCANEFCLKTRASIQAAADTKSVYHGIRKAVDITSTSSTGKILHNRDEQLGRWVQYFSLLKYKHNIVTDASLKHMKSLQT